MLVQLHEIGVAFIQTAEKNYDGKVAKEHLMFSQCMDRLEDETNFVLELVRSLFFLEMELQALSEYITPRLFPVGRSTCCMDSDAKEEKSLSRKSKRGE